MGFKEARELFTFTFVMFSSWLFAVVAVVACGTVVVLLVKHVALSILNVWGIHA